MNGYRFDGKIVLVTGAGGGVGTGLCRYFCERGATVLAAGRNRETLARLAGTLGADCLPVAADVTDLPALRAALTPVIERTGHVGILVNNAGAAAAATLSELTPATWRQDLDLNLGGAYHCVEVVKQEMLARAEGVIINVGSVNSLAALGHPAYSAAKAGLISYTRALAAEYGPKGIRANLLNLGTIRTRAWDERVSREPEVFERLKKWYPLRRFAEPQDVAALCGFLASDDARCITGAIIPVDAGLTAGNTVMAAELTLKEF
jgi:NAD(P)-dependent dehydrogenase (short-subunit alcohol dehydrogenase family)